jgi:hypothetical protein
MNLAGRRERIVDAPFNTTSPRPDTSSYNDVAKCRDAASSLLARRATGSVLRFRDDRTPSPYSVPSAECSDGRGSA